jgi:hypothetical protein
MATLILFRYSEPAFSPNNHLGLWHIFRIAGRLGRGDKLGLAIEPIKVNAG